MEELISALGSMDLMQEIRITKTGEESWRMEMIGLEAGTNYGKDN